MTTISHHHNEFSNGRYPYRFTVQVWCSAIGWADAQAGEPDSAQAAHLAAVRLGADDSKWVNPAAPRQLRIVSSR